MHSNLPSPALLLRRCPVAAAQVLGVVGALDPHTHKINQASLSGEGKLEKEGVRPMRLNNNLGGVAVVQGTARGVGAAFGLDDTGGTGGLPPPTGRPHGRGTGDDGVGDLFPTSGLMSSSDEYFPTVAINALVRLLRDPALTSQHSAVIEALMSIFRALSLQSVPYLPKVWGTECVKGGRGEA
eukprot:359878-Chlamydomonas_euryale.AAC.4